MSRRWVLGTGSWSVHRASTSSRKINQPRRHRDTEILCVFVSLWLCVSVAYYLCAVRLLRVDYADELLGPQRYVVPATTSLCGRVRSTSSPDESPTSSVSA